MTREDFYVYVNSLDGDGLVITDDDMVREAINNFAGLEGPELEINDGWDEDDEQDEVDEDGLSDDGYELSDGGVIEYPDKDGEIRRRDVHGNCEEIRRPGEENYDEWAGLFPGDKTLETVRHAAADKALEESNLDSVGGWEIDSNKWTCDVQYKNPTDENNKGGRFGVRFKENSTIIEDTWQE